MEPSKSEGPGKRILLGAGTVLNGVFVALGVILLLLLPFGLLRLAMEKHWAWGFPVIVFFCFLIYLSNREFRQGRLKTWQGINAIAANLLLAVLVFSFLSFALNKAGIAHYQGFTRQALDETGSITFNLMDFYFWQLFELIPGVKINEAFGRNNSPLQKFGNGAGLLLLGFRVVIIFVMLKGFRDWWVRRGAVENKLLVQRWFAEVWNKGRAEAIDEMMAQNAIAHGLSDDAETPLKGPAGFKPFHETFRGAFPDVEVVVEDMIAEGDKVAARCSVRAKHAGDNLGIKASGAPVDFTGIAIVRVRDGKFVEAWNNFDFMRMNKQIGAI